MTAPMTEEQIAEIRASHGPGGIAGYCRCTQVPPCDATILLAEVERLRTQLPAEMQNCTILFKECEKGHGRLTAANWIDHGCSTCALEAAWKDGGDR